MITVIEMRTTEGRKRKRRKRRRKRRRRKRKGRRKEFGTDDYEMPNRHP